LNLYCCENKLFSYQIGPEILTSNSQNLNDNNSDNNNDNNNNNNDYDNSNNSNNNSNSEPSGCNAYYDHSNSFVPPQSCPSFKPICCGLCDNRYCCQTAVFAVEQSKCTNNNPSLRPSVFHFETLIFLFYFFIFFFFLLKNDEFYNGFRMKDFWIIAVGVLIGVLVIFTILRCRKMVCFRTTNNNNSRNHRTTRLFPNHRTNNRRRPNSISNNSNNTNHNVNTGIVFPADIYFTNESNEYFPKTNIDTPPAYDSLKYYFFHIFSLIHVILIVCIQI
jgi:hypothetical protein